MYTHELINLLKSFNQKELMWFNKFLKSPYFNNRKRLLSLFIVLKNFYPEFDSKNFTKENLYKKVYGATKYNDSTFRNLMSDLLQLALQFLKLEGIEKNEIDSSFYLTTELFERENFKLFRILMDKSKRKLESYNSLSSGYFLNNYRIDTDSFSVNLLTQKVIKKNYAVSESERLINGIVNILNYFIIESIKHNDNLLQFSRSYNIQKNINTVSNFINIINFENLISYIKNNSTSLVPIVEVYYNLLKAYTYLNDEKYYFEFKKSFLNCSKYLGMGDNNFLHLRMVGNCILKINLGVQTSFDLNEEIFDLYEIYIKKEFFKTDSSKYLPFDTYRNILLNCIVVKKLNYMEDFIKNYSKNLLPNHVQSVENYSYALLFFQKGLYNKALACINRIKFDQFVYKLDMKNLQLKINFELNQFESALSVIDTYKHFLKNNVLISESRRIMHSNFVTSTLKLIQYKTGSQKTNLPFISDKIEKSKNVFDKGWLLDKVKDLQKIK